MSEAITAPTETAAPATPPVAEPSKAEAEYERRLEEVLAVDRATKESQRQVDIRLKKAQELEAKYGGIEEKRAKKEHVALARDMFGDDLNEDLLMELAGELAKAKEPKDPDKVFEERYAAKEAEKEAKAKAAADAKALEAKAAEDAELSSYLAKSGAALTEKAADFPLCVALGVDSAHYAELRYKFIEEKNAVPEPADLFALVEAEHQARLDKTPYRRAAAAKDEGVTVHPIVPRGQAPAHFDTAEDEVRAMLRKYDQEKRDSKALGR